MGDHIIYTEASGKTMPKCYTDTWKLPAKENPPIRYIMRQGKPRKKWYTQILIAIAKAMAVTKRHFKEE